MNLTSPPLRLTSAELFALTDDGQGNALGRFRRRLKFTLRLAWNRSHLRRLQHHFEGHGIHLLLRQDITLLLKGTRPYLWNGLGAQARFEAQMRHFDWLVQHFSAPAVRAFYAAGRRTLLSLQRGDHTVSLHLQPAYGLGREGELELHLCLDGQEVLRAAMSVLPASSLGMGGGQVLCVGSVQGNRDGKEQVQQLTALMERTRPSGLMMQALQGLAQAWGVAALIGVSDQGHVYAGYRGLAKRVGQRYDDLWQELGATERCNATHWQLPMQWTARDESEVPSNKRSQLRRRNALREQILQACRQSALDLQ
jgi:uncharacterized protein VirK/YbjX